jgi:hypothetical protein
LGGLSETMPSGEACGELFSIERGAWQMSLECEVTSKGRVIVSLNDHPDIRRAFDGFHIETVDIKYTVGGGGREALSNRLRLDYLLRRPLLLNEQEAAMEPPRVVFMGATIFPIVVRSSSGFSSMAIIVDGNHEQRGSGTLGTFETPDAAFKCAVDHAKAEIRRHCLMTMIC